MTPSDDRPLETIAFFLVLGILACGIAYFLYRKLVITVDEWRDMFNT